MTTVAGLCPPWCVDHGRSNRLDGVAVHDSAGIAPAVVTDEDPIQVRVTRWDDSGGQDGEVEVQVGDYYFDPARARALAESLLELADLAEVRR